MEEGDGREPSGKLKMVTRGQPQALARVQAKWEKKKRCGSSVCGCRAVVTLDDWDAEEQIAGLRTGSFVRTVGKRRSGSCFK